MELHDDTALRPGANLTPEDHDLRDDSARSHRGWWFAAIVAVDALAILAFIAWVVIPKLT
jgi:hypothetical protein